MRTLVVQGDWLLRRAHYENLRMTMHHGPDRLYCGGFVGVIDHIRTAIAEHLIDKVVVVWDGMLDGLNKYDKYPALRAEKEKVWNRRLKLQEEHGVRSSKEEHEFQIQQQRVKLQKHFGELSVRQVDEERSESMDAIALYAKEAVQVGEELIILSREHDFSQLISEHISLLRYDGSRVTHRNFFDLYGYDHTNDLMLKCFIGMPSGVVHGVKGLTLARMTHYFNGLKLEHYSYNDLIEYARRKRVDVRLKVYDAVLGAYDVLKRNSYLVNMQEPFLNTELHTQVNYCLYSPLGEGRLDELVIRYERENYKTHVKEDIKTYFEPFHRIILKEKEYSLFHEQVNI
jgi:hypothetical protein